MNGYKKDVARLQKVFEPLKYDITVEENKTAQEMEAIIGEWSKLDLSDPECIVVIMLTHGGEHGVIYGVDNQPVSLEKVTAKFSEKFEDTKKIFMIQACRGDLTAQLNFETPSQGPHVVPAGVTFHEKKNDTLVYYSTYDGMTLHSFCFIGNSVA